MNRGVHGNWDEDYRIREILIRRTVMDCFLPVRIFQRVVRLRSDIGGYDVVRLFIGTQNRLVALHSALIKAHEETDLSPRSVIYRPVGSTMQLVTKLSSPNFAGSHSIADESVRGWGFRLR